MVFVLALAPQHLKYETLVPSRQWLLIAGTAALFFGAIVFFIIRRWGISQVSNATLIPVLATLVFLLGFYGKELDLNYSSRPLARMIEREAPGEKIIAVDEIKRDMDYGLAFYRNSPLVHYSSTGDDGACPASVPVQQHVLVIAANKIAELNRCLVGRVYVPLFLYESQGLEVYRVYAKE
jgi:hypothetical protein